MVISKIYIRIKRNVSVSNTLISRTKKYILLERRSVAGLAGID